MNLSEVIIQRILQEGLISFHDFMEMALYYPELGYYTSKYNKIGSTGDYYTSSSLTPLFGAMIGKQLEEMWAILGKGPFTIVEYGAGTGALCHAILDYLKKNKKFYRQVRYCIIEKSPTMRQKEKMHLSEKVTWHDSIRSIPKINGCILSNELVDNFAIHQIVMKDELMEVFVGYEDGFFERLKPASKRLKDYLSSLKVTLPQGFRTEINLKATEWIQELAESLQMGYVMTIDYGYPSEELYRGYRSQGTLLCYHKHTVNDDPYRDIGKQDITTHVNFSALHHWGARNGLEPCGFTDQGHFLLALGFKDYLKKTLSPEQHLGRNETFLINTLLRDMGTRYKVLIQHKGAPKQRLLGLSLS